MKYFFYFFLYFLNFSFIKSILFKNLDYRLNERTNLKSIFTIYGIFEDQSYRILFNNISEQFRQNYKFNFCKFLNFSEKQVFTKIQFERTTNTEKTVQLIQPKPCCSL